MTQPPPSTPDTATSAAPSTDSARPARAARPALFGAAPATTAPAPGDKRISVLASLEPAPASTRQPRRRSVLLVAGLAVALLSVGLVVAWLLTTEEPPLASAPLSTPIAPLAAKPSTPAPPPGEQLDIGMRDVDAAPAPANIERIPLPAQAEGGPAQAPADDVIEASINPLSSLSPTAQASAASPNADSAEHRNLLSALAAPTQPPTAAKGKAVSTPRKATTRTTRQAKTPPAPIDTDVLLLEALLSHGQKAPPEPSNGARP